MGSLTLGAQYVDAAQVLPEAVSKLTEKEREAVELVCYRYNSKEIARELGISPSSVEKRISSARQKFGGIGREALARLYAEATGTGIGFDPAHGQSIPGHSMSVARAQINPPHQPGQTAGGSFVPKIQARQLGIAHRLVLIGVGAVAIAGAAAMMLFVALLLQKLTTVLMSLG